MFLGQDFNSGYPEYKAAARAVTYGGQDRGSCKHANKFSGA